MHRSAGQMMQTTPSSHRRELDRRTPLVHAPHQPAEIPLLRVAAGRSALCHARVDEAVEIGRDAGSSLPIDDPSVSRHHARVFRSGREFAIEDLGSRNGTYVNTLRVTRALLTPGDLVEVGNVPLRFDYVTTTELEQLRLALHRLQAPQRDPLTGLLTRLWMQEGLPARLTECARESLAVSALFLDVDHFKAINDRFGHSLGDAVLRDVSGIVMASIRQADPAIRYGGEEIVVVLEDAADGAAEQVAERIRAAIERHDWGQLHGELRVTASIGVAERRGRERVEAWLDRADAALYDAKHAGRNRVRTWQADRSEAGSKLGGAR